MSDDDWTTGIDALVISECRRCARRWYLRRDRCPHCGATGHRRLPSTGTGTAAAVTVTRTPAGGDHPDVPFAICLVDLDEGVRVMGRAALLTRVGDRVHVTWERHQPVFVPAGPATGAHHPR
jgi:uncharacterized OB-fold protein